MRLRHSDVAKSIHSLSLNNFESEELEIGISKGEHIQDPGYGIEWARRLE
jgi:hypothetical protein